MLQLLLMSQLEEPPGCGMSVLSSVQPQAMTFVWFAPTCFSSIGIPIDLARMCAKQVASQLLRSMEKGHYHLASPDLGQNLLMGSLAGLSPPPYLSLVSLLGCILPLVFAYLRWSIDAVVKKIYCTPPVASRGNASSAQHETSAGLLEKHS